MLEEAKRHERLAELHFAAARRWYERVNELKKELRVKE